MDGATVMPTIHTIINKVEIRVQGLLYSSIRVD